MKAVAMDPLTVEDYRLLPDGGPRYQLIEGDLFMAPAPNRYHQEISGNIYLLLAKYLEKHPAGKLYAAPFDVYFDEINVHQPDLVFVSKKNLAILTDAGAEGAPDFIVEILSPKTAGHLRWWISMAAAGFRSGPARAGWVQTRSRTSRN